MDLFSAARSENHIPLAVRMRPEHLDDFYGQADVMGEGSFLRRMIEADKVPSILLYGPPGTGKTTLAQIIAKHTGAEFIQLNAVSSGVADIKRVVKEAKDRFYLYSTRTILFIDEIHRFNKSQQDALLPYVEDGTVTLIGATTENPYFEVNSPLLSRLRIVRLVGLDNQAIKLILHRALHKDCQLTANSIQCDPKALDMIVEISAGDARVALNILEQAAYLLPHESAEKIISADTVAQAAGEKTLHYDKHGDNHYDVVSAFIKSMRGSDPDAAIHYLARMLTAGEDVNFIARRMIICAAEDVGLADPQALVIANAAAQAAHQLGMPEARIPLAEAVIYIAAAPKSNSAYLAINKAMDEIKHTPIGQVPVHLRDGSYRGAAKLGHGKDYVYPHNYPLAYVAQQYLPQELEGHQYYHPKTQGQEERLSNWLLSLRNKHTKI